MTQTTIQKIKDHALTNDIPIIHDDVASMLKHLIQKYQLKKILEIGTATSYSAQIMASSGSEVWTIERNLTRFSIAKNFIETSELRDQIHVIHEDALTYQLKDNDFDLIFIDAAKSQYIRFFEKYQAHLKDNGIIVVDNIFFHHLDPTKVNRHTRQLLKKLDKFKLYLAEHQVFHTQIFEIGDGLSVSYKNQKLYEDLQSIMI